MNNSSLGTIPLFPSFLSFWSVAPVEAESDFSGNIGIQAGDKNIIQLVQISVFRLNLHLVL